MHTNEPRELQGVELGYDPRDIDAKGIYKIVVYFFLFALVFFGGGAIIFVRQGWGGRTSFDSRKPAFAGPKVQGNIAAKIDIMAMRQHERRVMESYKDLQNGKWQIPVDRAMALVAAEGLPAVASDQKAVSPGNTIPQNATGPAASSTPTSPSESAPGEDRLNGKPSVSTGEGEPGLVPPTPDLGQGATGTTAGGAGMGGAARP
jgi:hypothetical protein